MLKRVAAIIFGLGLALLVIEVGVRIVYISLPYSIQLQTSGARQWVFVGKPLGLLLNSLNFYETCIGDVRLYARMLPKLDRVPIRAGPQDVYHVTTTQFDFEDIGFRAPESNGPWDGVVVGDSFSFCMGVETQECWVQLLAENGIHLANLGVPGTGSVSHLRYLEDYGWAFEPKIVLWQYFVNDPANDYHHIHDEGQGCPRPQTSPVSKAIESPSKVVRDWLSHTFVTYNLVLAPALRAALPQLASPRGDPEPFEQIITTNNKRFLTYTGTPLSDNPQAISGMELTQEAILLAAQEAWKHKSLFVLILAPDPLQVYSASLSSEPLVFRAQEYDKTMDELIRFAEEHNIETIDLRSGFREAAYSGDDSLYLEYDTHWNVNGNRLVAKIVSDWLLQHK